ncbi:MAG: aldehyde dehydrogenase family protein [Rhodobacter sp.]|nr:aldehyde dehydrogenase family protein [Rhodobacter sp.]
MPTKMLIDGEPVAGDGAGLFYRRTVVAQGDARAETATPEGFGPVVTQLHVTDAKDALTFANASRCGLAASVRAARTVSGVGGDRSVCALDADTALRHMMIAH